MPSILDHISLGVSDYEKARQFYNRVLPTLGIAIVWEKPNMVAYGIDGDDQFGLQADTAAPRTGTHVAFRAPNRDSVNRFHAEALAAGALDNGLPGVRPDYSGTYYAAFVFDPDGNRIEAVFHEPTG
jgi:catechol 2,3-dioxygenase-like lactoylglutathione lyase family enzyme